MGSNGSGETQRHQIHLGVWDWPEGAACCTGEVNAFHLQKFTFNRSPTVTGGRFTLHPTSWKTWKDLGNCCSSLGLTSVLGKIVGLPPLGIHFQTHEGLEGTINTNLAKPDSAWPPNCLLWWLMATQMMKSSSDLSKGFDSVSHSTPIWKLSFFSCLSSHPDECSCEHHHPHVSHLSFALIL